MGRLARFGARPDTGRRAEDLAAAELERLGLRIVARNWRRPEGELDIVADDDGTCVFVEVRSRTGEEHGHAAGGDHAAQTRARDPRGAPVSRRGDGRGDRLPLRRRGGHVLGRRPRARARARPRRVRGSRCVERRAEVTTYRPPVVEAGRRCPLTKSVQTQSF